jgi:hypothetical protein
MPIHHPEGTAYPEYQDLDRRLREGDGIHWSGDPRLWLGVGVLENRVTGKTGRRLEVWRDNEDGSTTLIAHWLPAEQYRILYDLAGMRADAPGHVDVLDKIDTHNEAVEKANSQAHQEAIYQTLEHAVELHVERNEGKIKHFIPEPAAPAETKAPDAGE